MPYTRFTEELQDVTEPSDNRRGSCELTLQFPAGELTVSSHEIGIDRLRAASMARGLRICGVDMTYSILVDLAIGVFPGRFSATAT